MARQETTWGLATLLAVSVLAGLAAGQAETPEVLVMFDLGDGSVYWQESPLSENRTAIKATEDAAEALGLSIEVFWSEFGAFVADIGGRDPAFPEYFHFLLWNASTRDWELSPLGASSLLLKTDDVLGWFLSADDAEWDFVSSWPGPKPLATPDHPFPMSSFRGNLANTGASGSPVPEAPQLRWQFDTGGSEIGASPVGAGGTVFQVTLFNGTYAIDLDTGDRLWRNEEVSGLSTPALTLEGSAQGPPDLILGGRDGALYRIGGEAGDIIWRVTLQTEATFTGLASSPKVSQGHAFIGVFNETGGPGALVAVNIVDGTISWRHETSSIHMSSPALHRGSVYVGLMGLFNASSLTWDPPYGLLRVNEGDGKEEWLFPTSGPVASSPVVLEGGAVYFTSRDGYLYGVSTEGTLLEQRSIGPSTSSPAMLGDVLYAASGVLGAGGNVTAEGLQTGTLWSFMPNGPVQSSLTLASGVLLFTTNTEDGTAYALDAASGAVLWTYVPQPQQYVLPTPTVLDGFVVIASDNGMVYALGPAEAPEFDAGLLAATTVTLAGIVIGVAIFVYAWRLGAFR